MNLGNEVIVKNFHVLKTGQEVVDQKKDGRIYFKIQKAGGPTTDAERAEVITTDQFCLDWIKRVRLSRPTAPVFRKWEITMPDIRVNADADATPAVTGTDGVIPGTLLTVYMHFTNLYGYGLTDRWEKFATIMVKNNSTKGSLASDMAAEINNQYIKGMKPINATADTTNGKVILEDNTFPEQRPTRRRMEMQMDPQPIEMYITTNLVTKYAGRVDSVDEDEWQWAPEVATATQAHKQYNGVEDTAKSYNNAYLIWGLEKVSQMNSVETMADSCSGFAGWDSVMDGLIDGAMLNANAADYWVLDIAYETLPKMGAPSSRNLKELSFACVGTGKGKTATPPTQLTAVLTALGLQYNSTTKQVEPITVNTSGGNNTSGN